MANSINLHSKLNTHDYTAQIFNPQLVLIELTKPNLGLKYIFFI